MLLNKANASMTRNSTYAKIVSPFSTVKHPVIFSRMDNSTLTKFKKAMEFIYSTTPFDEISESASSSWLPKHLSEGHRGRYLWTDGFAVINFLTLFKETGEQKYLTFATKLVDSVHSTLGYHRDGLSRLPYATSEEPLLGGLRIGKLDEDGEDGDGQYFHYLTIWMLALLQIGVASKNNWYLAQANSLAKAIHPKFMSARTSTRPRMYWKMSMDLSHPLVNSEGNLDPIDGYVVYSMVQDAQPSPTLNQEISEYRKIVKVKANSYGSNDPLDLGMTLWTTSHWPEGGDAEASAWNHSLTTSATQCLRSVRESNYFSKSLTRRLAFREFGTILGIMSHSNTEAEFGDLCRSILNQWKESGIFEGRSSLLSHRLQPITYVMYATALFPGAFLKNYFMT